MSTKNLVKLVPKNAGVKLPQQEPPPSFGQVVDIIQRGVKKDEKLVIREVDKVKYFFVCYTMSIGGAAVSEKFAKLFNQKLTDAQNNDAEKAYYEKRQPITIDNCCRDACIIPDDCSRTDPILIGTFRDFLDNGDCSCNGRLFPGFPPTSDWRLLLVPMEHKDNFKIVMYDGGSEQVEIP